MEQLALKNNKTRSIPTIKHNMLQLFDTYMEGLLGLFESNRQHNILKLKLLYPSFTQFINSIRITFTAKT